MSTHTLGFRAKKEEKNANPCKPQFNYRYVNWTVMGYTLYKLVSKMTKMAYVKLT